MQTPSESHEASLGGLLARQFKRLNPLTQMPDILVAMVPEPAAKRAQRLDDLGSNRPDRSLGCR
jgi:hypothetical protein